MIGGGGAVGLSAIQLAVATGCHVSTTCGVQSIDQVLAVGAEQAVDYTREVLIAWVGIGVTVGLISICLGSGKILIEILCHGL